MDSFNASILFETPPIFALDRLQKIIINNAYHVQDMPNELNQAQNYHQNIRGAEYYLKSHGVAHA